MKLRPVSVAAALAGLLTIVAAPASPAHASTVAPPSRAVATMSGADALPGSACHPGTPPNAPATTEYYDPAEPAFGPATLPVAKPVGPLLIAYRRFGSLTEAQFAAKYRNGSSWIYPPDDGFLTLGGEPIEYEHELWPGTEIDRFGYPGGSYLSPSGTLFTMRALPPQNLNTPSDTPLANYHLYCVTKAFPVDAGPIAPWFEQLGLGTQYKLDGAMLPEAGSALSVTWLLTHGYLVEENPS